METGATTGCMKDWCRKGWLCEGWSLLKLSANYSGGQVKQVLATIPEELFIHTCRSVLFLRSVKQL